jgi:hypothetical protein
MSTSPDHLPDWLFWLVAVILPAFYALRLVWQSCDWRTPGAAARMTQDDVIAAVQTAITAQPNGRAPTLAITEWPSARNAGLWTVRESTKGSWWIAQVNDVTGEVVNLRRQGVR